jgi:hypothetical protein
MSRSVFLLAMLMLSLAACQQSAPEPASATPDPADTASADTQPAPADTSANVPPLKKPSATDVPMPGSVAASTATVGTSGFGAVRYGMNRSDAEQAAGGAFDAPTQGSACRQMHRADQPGIAYLFEDDKLQRIDVRTPGILADGGGHVGMQIDEIRTLYAGKLTEQPHKYVPNGRYLKVAGPNGSGMIFETDADGKVTSFRAGIAPALDQVEGCS